MMIAGGCIAAAATSAMAQNRVSASQKGSVLYYSKIELKWDAAGFLIQDTFVTLVNDLNRDVCVHWHFINGDEPVAAVPPIPGEPGWNMYDCSPCYTPNENVFFSAARGGGSLGCGQFTGLDPGAPGFQGRLDTEGSPGSLPGDRILRGFGIAIAVDHNGEVVNYNHLTGHVDIVNYRNQSAWEYNAYAFQCRLAGGASELPGVTICGTNSTELLLNGTEYDSAWDQILFDFYAVNDVVPASVFSRPVPATAVALETDLTLYPVSIDLRPNFTNTSGPVLTRADIVIWNENEDDRTGTSRCINCWDQTLLSDYDAPNNFLQSLLNTDKGYARINGVQADSCDAPGSCCCVRRCSNGNNVCENDSWCGTPPNQGTCGLFGCFDPDCDQVDFARGTPDRDCSESAALLGVSDKIMSFSGVGGAGITDAGMTLVAIGTQNATIIRDIIPPTAPATEGQDGPEEVGSEDAEVASPRQTTRGLRGNKE